MSLTHPQAKCHWPIFLQAKCHWPILPQANCCPRICCNREAILQQSIPDQRPLPHAEECCKHHVCGVQRVNEVGRKGILLLHCIGFPETPEASLPWPPDHYYRHPPLPTRHPLSLLSPSWSLNCNNRPPPPTPHTHTLKPMSPAALVNLAVL